MASNPQEQYVEDGSAAIQAGNDVNLHVGLTLAEARQVAIDVFRANFYELAGVAKQTATERATEITEAFLKKLESENPEGMQKANDPDFQYDLFGVQRDYARSGDRDLGDLLIDLLVDRSKQENRDLLQLVLNESLTTAPKLTAGQIATLSAVFFLKYTQNQAIGTVDRFAEHLRQNVTPLIPGMATSDASMQHIEFSGCGSISIASSTLENVFGATYKGLFVKGFTGEELNLRGIPLELVPRFFCQCINADPGILQVMAINDDLLSTRLAEDDQVDDDVREKIKTMFNESKFSDPEIRQRVVELVPETEQLFQRWNDTQVKHLNLTSVGIAIGHANLKRVSGDFSSLSIWVN